MQAGIQVLHQVVVHDNRALHVRRLGVGPPVVMLHESPRSGAVLLPLAEALAARFTVFALDTPGYGASDPLDLARPEITDFADAIAASLTALGLRRVAVYGTHTGATIALELGRRHPGLVAGLVLDGYPVFTPAERAAHHSHYLPAFRPEWDGSHVARLWARVRDQYAFFPWYQPGRDTRLDRAQPSPAALTAVVRDFLAAGAGYATAYAASFRFDPHAALSGLTVPTRLMTREDDLLFPHLDRLGALPPGVAIQRLGAERAAWMQAVGDALGGWAEGAAPPSLEALPDGTRGGTLAASGGDLLLRCHGAATAEPPLLLLHDSPGGAWQCRAVAQAEAARRQIIVPELPGHGLSPPHPAERNALPAMVERLLALVERIGAPRLDIAGWGSGAVLAHRLARATRGRIRRLVLVDPPRGDGTPVTQLMPWIEPSWDGAHLMAAWWQRRDALLYRPWCDRSAAARRMVGPALDVQALHRGFVSLMLADNNHLPLAQAAQEDAASVFEDAGARTAVLLAEEDPDAAALAEAFWAHDTEVSLAGADTQTDRLLRLLRDA